MMRRRPIVPATLLTCLVCSPSAWALIRVGETNPVKNAHWPTGAEAMANLPSRHSYWEGPPFGGGNYHFNYTGQTAADFQVALGAFAAIKAPRLELMIFDGVSTNLSPFARGPVHWEFEIWDSARFEVLNHSGHNITMSISPWFGRPVPAPLLTLYLGPDNPVNWSAVLVPASVTLLDRRVATSPYANSTGGVVRATTQDMADLKPLAGAVLEVGHYADRVFQADASVTAGADGVAVVRDLPAGNYVLRVRREGYATRQIGHFKNYGRTLGIFDEVRLAPVAALRGRVIDKDGKPIQGAVIGLTGLVGLDGTGYEQNLYNEQTNVQSDADGRFVLDALPTGRACLRVQKPAYHYFSFDTHEVPGDAVTITMTTSGVIRGRVMGTERLATGQAAYVSLEPVGERIGRWAGEMPCAADGAYLFEGIPPDSYTLTPLVVRPNPRGGYSKDSNAPAQSSTQIILKPGEQLEVNLELK